MTKINKTLALVATAAALIGSSALAQAGGTSMPTGGRTTQPVGHYEFCRAAPAECSQRTPRKEPVELTRQLWSQIVEINASVNAEVQPKTDREIWGVEEKWSYPVDVGGTKAGDCEDYALEKRRRLMALGVAPGDLLMTVARQPNGDGHAVLTMRTSLGDFILDNLEARVVSWEQTPYTYLKRQSETNSGVWVLISDGRADAVASVR